MEKSAKVVYRHYAIKELISGRTIESQQQLLALLKDEYQIETNQSIISRDLADLGVIKQKYKDKVIYELPHDDVNREILRLGVQSVVCNETMIVVNTLRGLPPFIGDYLDQKKDSGVLATLAGENVVFVVPTSIKNINAVYNNVCDVLFYKIEEPVAEQAATGTVSAPVQKSRAKHKDMV